MSDSDFSSTVEDGPVKPAGSSWGNVFWLVVVLIFAGLFVFFSFIWLGKRGIDATKEAAVEIVTAFKPDVVVDSFEEWREMKVKGTAPITRVTLIRNEKDYEIFEPQAISAEFAKTFVDEKPEPGEYRYYVRVEQGDGNMGWTSPVWVTVN